MKKILIVDDEAVVHEILSRYLRREGFQVFSVRDGDDALDSIRTHKPDLILLDILLPGLDGLEICRELRKETDIPVIFITSKDASFDLALGLGVGGDDYIKKPFDPIEVAARVKAQLRRYRQLRMARAGKERKEGILEFPGLRINLSNHTVEANGSVVALTAKEFGLLVLLAENPNRFFSADELMERLWNTPDSVDNRSLMVHMSKLRKKIEAEPASPQYIVTLRGVGYKFRDS